VVASNLKAFAVSLVRELTLTRRRLVFFYDIGTLLVLLILAVLYARHKDATCLKAWIRPEYRLFVHCMWLGALGGVSISLKGVYDNAGDPPWSNRFNLWHLGRPFSGAVTGLVTVLIFSFMTQGGGALNRPVVYLAAFILGTQEARFFTFLAEIGRIIVQVPPSLKPPTLRITAVQPNQGPSGTAVIVAGQAFEQGAVVKLGGEKLGQQVVAPDGVSIAGIVPKLGKTPPWLADVTVYNPNSGATAILSDGFKYAGDA
jgi:hypothetical protein